MRTKLILSKREKQVLCLLSMYYSPKEIAQIIAKFENISLSHLTINSMINKQLYYKFNVNSISQLMHKAFKMRLVPFTLS